MPQTIDLADLRVCVFAEPLTVAAFAPFGDVIENPRPDVQPSQFAAAFGAASAPKPYSPVSANQGSAIKYQHVSLPADRYAAAPSGRPSSAVTNMFVCAARTLLGQNEADGSGLFPVTILERHPFTTQTFVPLTTGAGERRYLVIVAPTLSDKVDRPPDLGRLRAFVARGDQAVTYGAATWHAPMAALGAAGTSLAFAVFQFANGVGPEDCQEVVWDSGAVGDDTKSAVTVKVPPAAPGSETKCPFASKL